MQGQGRALLLAAAREMFSERGYNGSSTREIADRAGVSEPMLFRHFGNKANLFEAAATGPVIEYIRDWVAEWRAGSRWTTRPILDEARDFYAGLLGVLQPQRELLTALLAAHRFGQVDADIAERLHMSFEQIMRLIEATLAEDTTAGTFSDTDRAATARILVGMVLSVALHDDWLMADGVDQDRMLDEMARLTMLGLLART